jgi:nucleoside-diphosphate-sugar epimerase
VNEEVDAQAQRWACVGAGTNKLVDAAIAAGVPKLVLVSSLLTNGLEAGQALNRNYILLNLFGGVLIAKNIAERYIMGKSELDWTIVRPGGLREGPSVGNIVYGPADSLFGGSIAREQVAAVSDVRKHCKRSHAWLTNV